MTMKLKAVLDDLTTVPGRLADAYDKGDDGRWHLQVEGDVDGAKADADRLFDQLAARIRSDVLDTALRAAGGDRTLLEPHLTAHIHVDRKSLAVRVLGADGKFANLATVIDDLKKRPGFASAFDKVEATERSAGNDERPVNLTEAMAAEKARRATVRADVPKPITMDPHDRRFSLGSCMAWAGKDPARIAEVRSNFAGR